MLALSAPGTLEMLIIGLIGLFVIVLPITILVIVVTLLVKKRKSQITQSRATSSDSA